MVKATKMHYRKDFMNVPNNKDRTEGNQTIFCILKNLDYFAFEVQTVQQ